IAEPYGRRRGTANTGRADRTDHPPRHARTAWHRGPRVESLAATNFEGSAMTRALGLEGKIALVTGAGAGIGRGCALALADAGASVIVNDIDSAASEAVVRKCEERGSRALAVCADMTDSREVVRVYDVAERQWGPVQIVVSCVGTSVRRPLLETTAEQLHRTVELIVYSAFH